MTAFVPTYRCGAVPDSHRVPFFDALKQSVPTVVYLHIVGVVTCQYKIWLKDGLEDYWDRKNRNKSAEYDDRCSQSRILTVLFGEDEINYCRR
ncbi:MAG: hypothetical protein QOF64_2021 [Candidatus Binatota bacterium]|nr:hypothetical protein [Candidatus Binatota bacterium]